MAITVSILDQFAKFFRCCKDKNKFPTKPLLVYPPHLKHVAALPGEISGNIEFPETLRPYFSEKKWRYGLELAKEVFLFFSVNKRTSKTSQSRGTNTWHTYR